MIEKLEAIKLNNDLKEELADRFISEIMSQLNILNPAEEAEEILNILEACNVESPQETLIAYLLGTLTVDEWLEEFEII